MSQKNHPQFYPHVLQNLFYSTFVEQISISFFLFLFVYQQVNTYYMPFIHLLPRDEKDFAQQIRRDKCGNGTCWNARYTKKGMSVFVADMPSLYAIKSLIAEPDRWPCKCLP